MIPYKIFTQFPSVKYSESQMVSPVARTSAVMPIEGEKDRADTPLFQQQNDAAALAPSARPKLVAPDLYAHHYHLLQRMESSSLDHPHGLLWYPYVSENLVEIPLRILACVENENLEFLLKTALGLGEKYRAYLEIIHVLERGQSRDSLLLKFNAAVDKVVQDGFTGPRPECRIMEGEGVATLLLGAAHAEHASLLVIGKSVMGSSQPSEAEDLLHRAPCPVLVCSRELKDVQHLLVPVDGTPFSYRALEQALILAKDYRAQISLLHVDPTSEQAQKFQETYAPVMEQVAWGEVSHKLETRSGTVEEAVLRYVHEEKIDLVVMGIHSDPKHPLSHGQTIALSRLLGCGLLVVHPQLE